MRADIAEGVRWLVRHRVLRTLAIALGIINFVGIAAMTILVLYARDVLHLTDLQYGLLLAVEAAGAVLGTLVAARISARLGPGTTLVARDRGLGRLVPRPGALGPADGGGGIARGRRVRRARVERDHRVAAAVARPRRAARPGEQRLPARRLGHACRSARSTGGLVADAFGLRAPFLVAGVVALAARGLAQPDGRATAPSPRARRAVV